MNHHALINEQRERSLVLHRLAESIAARPFLLAALTLYWTWVNMAFIAVCAIPEPMAPEPTTYN